MGIPALPFSQSENAVSRPKPKSYPKILKTIGDHIRAWRLDNHLLQADVAKMLSVCEDSVIGWEIRGTTPTVRQMSGIIKLIGYVPLDIDTSTLAGRISYYRFIQGMTPHEFGALIPANASTVRDWERGKHIPTKDKMQRIEALMISSKV